MYNQFILQKCYSCQRSIKSKDPPTPPELPVEPKPPNLPTIATAMATNAADSFAGYGRHTINDFLFQLAIHPHTPAYVICSDDITYTRFKAHLHTYMKQYREPKFLKMAATVTNDANPFSFNQKSDDAYIGAWVQVFRRTKAFVPKALYEHYASLGLLDKDHTIGLCSSIFIYFLANISTGEPYTWDGRKGIEPCKGKFKEIPVYQDIHSKTYHIIQAKVPAGWLPGKMVFIIPIPPYFQYRHSPLCCHRNRLKRISQKLATKPPLE